MPQVVVIVGGGLAYGKRHAGDQPHDCQDSEAVLRLPGRLARLLPRLTQIQEGTRLAAGLLPLGTVEAHFWCCHKILTKPW